MASTMCWTSPWRCLKARTNPDAPPRPCLHGRGRVTCMTDTTTAVDITCVGDIAFADAQRLHHALLHFACQIQRFAVL